MRLGNAALLSCLLLSPSPLVPETGVSPALEKDIIERVRAKSVPVYQKYIGVDCRRVIISRQYDDRTGNYLGGYEAVLHRQEYFFKKARNTVLSFTRQGSMSVPKRFLFQTRPPIHPPFAADSAQHYDIKLAGRKVINDVECWELTVIPRKKTYRHLKGSVYFTVKGLDLLCIAGTVADYPFGVKCLSMEVYFKKLDDAYVLSYGMYSFTIHIPIFFPHKRLVQTFTSSDDRMIPVDK
jgi:hypothetical protein